MSPPLWKLTLGPSPPIPAASDTLVRRRRGSRVHEAHAEAALGFLAGLSLPAFDAGFPVRGGLPCLPLQRQPPPPPPARHSRNQIHLPALARGGPQGLLQPVAARRGALLCGPHHRHGSAAASSGAEGTAVPGRFIPAAASGAAGGVSPTPASLGRRRRAPWAPVPSPPDPGGPGEPGGPRGPHALRASAGGGSGRITRWGVALTAARSPPLARAGTNASGGRPARECGAGRAPLFKASAVPRRWRLRQQHAGGGLRSALSPPTRGPAEARGRGSPVPGGSRLLRGSTQESRPASPSRPPAASTGSGSGRQPPSPGRFPARLPPLPSSSPPPPFHLPFPAPTLRRRGAGPRPPPSSPPLGPRQWAGTQATADQLRDLAPSPSRLEKGRTAVPRRTPIADAQAPTATTAAAPRDVARLPFFFSSELAVMGSGRRDLARCRRATG